MPKLKKFRVVNLIYNDTRHIYDETFDFNDGDHAMMLLANGGGKTVLTQMMMQPVIPRTDLKTRKFSDYFKHNKRPTLLLNEWQLDDKTSTVLTGLIIKNRVRKKRGIDENVETLDIHAFTIHYHYSETYNINTIPVTYRDETGRKSMRDYDEIVTDLKKHAQKYDGFMSVFHWSDSSEAKRQYGEKLAEYGISQQEWKDNILKINKEEAGLKSFFEDAKTSVTLLKRKILPTIESKLDEKALDKVEIQTLFKNHAMEEVKNKKIIEDEKLYKQFIIESEKLEENVQKLDKAMQAVMHSGAEVAKVHKSFETEKEKCVNRIQLTELAKQDNRRAMEHIKFEEECFKYYKSEMVYDGFKESHRSLSKNLSSVNEQLAVASHSERVLQGAYTFELLSEANRNIQRKRMELEQLSKQENLVEYEQLSEILYVKYSDQIALLENESLKLEEIYLEIQEKQNIEEEHRKELDENKKEQHKILAITEYKVDGFDIKVKEHNKENDEFKWEKHVLYNDYESLLLENYISELDLIAKGNKENMLKSQKIIGNKEAEKEKLIRKIQDYNINHSVKEKELEQSRIMLNEYLGEEGNIYEKLKLLQIEQNEIFDQEYVHSQLDEVIFGKEERFNHLTIEKAITEQLGESLREGKLINLPEQVKEFLNDNQIEYRFGYEWLMEHQGDEIQKSLYMDTINILPYSLIMDDGSYNQFISLSKEYHMNIVLPIISESYIRLCMETEFSYVEGLTLHTAFEEGLLKEEYVSKEISKLTIKVSEIKYEQEIIARSKTMYQLQKAEYSNFMSRYNMKTKESLEIKVLDLEEYLNTNQEDIKIANETIVILVTEIQKNSDDIEMIQELLNQVIKRLDKYKLLMLDYGNYKENKLELSKANKALDAIAVQEKETNSLLAKYNNEKVELVEKLKQGKNEIEAYEKACLTLENKQPKESVRLLDLFNEALATLVIKYDAFNRTLGERKSIEENLNNYQQWRITHESNLEKLHLEQSEYIEKVYNEEWHTQLKKDVALLTLEEKRISDEIKGIAAILKDRETNLIDERNEILSKPNREKMISKVDLIHTDFRLRRQENQSEYKDMDKSLIELKQLKSELESAIEETKEHIQELIKDYQNLVISELLIDKLYSDADQLEAELYKDADQLEVGPFKAADQFEVKLTPVEIQNIRKHVIKEVQDARKKENKQTLEVLGNYNQLKSSFGDKNDLFGNLFSQLLKGDNIYDYDFVKRVLTQTNEAISRKLEKYDTDIKMLRSKEEALYNFVLTKVSNVYDELKDIDKHSIIDLNDKRQKMLYIQLPNKENIDESRLTHYMHDVIRIAKAKIESKELSDLDKYLDNHLKLEQLFDEFIPIASIGVHISKIEQNKVSKMTWEEVGKASGGELFVSVFIVFSSLLSYTRGFLLSRKQQGKVLVMDNPFGPVSSEHLLEPLFRIAETYDTQLVCFTHINTSAITNQFDLIYSLRVIQESGNRREHIQVELSKDKNRDIEFVDTGKFEIGDGNQIGFL